MKHTSYYAHYSATYLSELFNIRLAAGALIPYLASVFERSNLHPAFGLWALILLTRYCGRCLNHPITTVEKAKQAFLCAYYLAARTARKGYGQSGFWKEAGEELGMSFEEVGEMSSALEEEMGGGRVVDVTGTELCNMRAIVEKEATLPAGYEKRVSWWPREDI
ncbi:hypothetical protein BDQ17DRAFT_1351151 [Cyathus striatus]|nr:hypothetical protein BDQ17DRAFT_1351151 [Cyathus striatus]